ncbi:MAG: NAD-dependent epimerase/dehydratase family protein [Planctomycetota bacterium]
MNDPQEHSTTALITGATGLLGSHIAEQLHLRNIPFRALCRPDSDTRFLQTLGAKIVYGDLTDPESLRRACLGIDRVYHSAARVGDWGPWMDFVGISIEGTRHLLEAAANAKVGRFLHVSSISVYGQVDGEGLVLDERAPLGMNLTRWNYYGRAKVEAERLVWEMHESGRLPVTVIRPSWLYGPRDRATLPRLIDSIRRRKLKLIGDGNNRLNVVHAANVAEAAILAAQSEGAVGQAYNCSHDGILTQREYFNRIAAAIGEPDITALVPYAVASSAGFVLECLGHLFRTKHPPLVTRYTAWLMGRRCFFECNRVKNDLGWSSTIGYDEGIPAAVDDHLKRTAFDAPNTAAATPEPAETAV